MGGAGLSICWRILSSVSDGARSARLGPTVAAAPGSVTWQPEHFSWNSCWPCATSPDAPHDDVPPTRVLGVDEGALLAGVRDDGENVLIGSDPRPPCDEPSVSVP